ncbi:hypothetical protein ABN763_18345 [Spongiivirga sp. MCCC 1A20706]
MKKTLLLFMLLLTAVSCSLDDDDANFHYEFVPVVAAEFPENFVLGSTYTIPVEFARPTECHFFSNFSFTRPDNTTRRIGVVNSVFTDRDCSDISGDESIQTNSFDFMVIYEGTYTFQFWTGEDADGNNQYLEIQVPVLTEAPSN